MLESAGLDAAVVDEGVDFVLFESNHASEPVGRDVTLVDNLWLIAREHLIDETGTPVSDDAILRHWQRLIEVNRDRLENPDDPDLIFADQVLDLPAVDAG